MTGQRPAGVNRSLVFLDASVMVAASHSATGASALVMEVCRGRRFRAVVSPRVLLEARVNIAEKFGEADLIRFYQQLSALEPETVKTPPPERLAECALLVGHKDAHVMAAALESNAAYLLTLDRRHLITPAVSKARLPIKVMTPGDFIGELAAQSLDKE